MMFKILIVAASVSLSLLCNAQTVQILDPEISFQAVHRIANNIWASGTKGGIYHSADNGLTWQKVSSPQQSQDLQFRDIQPLADGGLIIMSAGEGDSSRVYRSDDEGLTWQLQVSGTSPHTFYDCIHFSDSKNGWLYGDSDEQGLFVLATMDGGAHWQRQSLPFAAQASEGGFASSGTCVNQGDNGAVYFATGNGDKPRILVQQDNSWQSIITPIAGGEASGVFSLQQGDDWLYVFGGSLKTEQDPAQAYQYNLTTSEWLALPPVPLTGAIYGSALLQDQDKITVLIANPQGVAAWHQGQQKWKVLSKNNIWSLSCDGKSTCVGVGKDGVIELITFP
jgi:photosystem II stability/assembly factor-like uncharacterized protein